MIALDAVLAMAVAPLAVARGRARLDAGRGLDRRAPLHRWTCRSGITWDARTCRRRSAAPWAPRPCSTSPGAPSASTSAAARRPGRGPASAVAVLGYSSLIVLFGLFGARPRSSCCALDAARPVPAPPRRAWWRRWSWAAWPRASLFYFHYVPGLLHGAGDAPAGARPVPAADLPHLPQRVAPEHEGLGGAASPPARRGPRWPRRSRCAGPALRARPIFAAWLDDVGAGHGGQGAVPLPAAHALGQGGPVHRVRSWPSSSAAALRACPARGCAGARERRRSRSRSGCSSAISATHDDGADAVSPRLRALAANLALAAVSTLLVLAAAEVVLRVRARQTKGGKEQRERNRYTEYDPVLGWRKTPGAAVVYDRREYHVEYRVNGRAACADRTGPTTKPPGVRARPGPRRFLRRGLHGRGRADGDGADGGGPGRRAAAPSR